MPLDSRLRRLEAHMTQTDERCPTCRDWPTHRPTYPTAGQGGTWTPPEYPGVRTVPARCPDRGRRPERLPVVDDWRPVRLPEEP